MAVITLTTDFGLADSYVAAMKGVILSINPNATIVDVSHGIQAQSVEQAVFILSTATPYFPPGTIHVAVVDPGVGTERRALILVTPRAVFVGPDNGLLSAALPEAAREAVRPPASPVPLPPALRGFELVEERFQRRPVSATFHGRDIFAPAAAHLSLGTEPSDFGPSVAEITALPPFRGIELPDGSVLGRVLHIDRFGNAITSVRADQVPGTLITVHVHGRSIPGLVRTYAEGIGPAALIGSSGFLEIAVPGDSAAHGLGLKVGDTVTVTPA
jgi:S-adenosylmethionine hydrolase